MNTPQPRCLILFAREPVAGQVKTRLILALGSEGALSLYRQLLQRQIDLVSHFDGAVPRLEVDGDQGHEMFSTFPGAVLPQQGGDIGEKMYRALAHALTEYESAVLIGCDCPEMGSDYLEQAFAALEAGADIVLGPATDGGYVLIGARRGRQLPPEIFQNISWGGGKVLTQTRGALRERGLSWDELTPLHDIDEPGDLDKLKKFDIVPSLST